MNETGEKKECRIQIKICRKEKTNIKKCRISRNLLHMNMCRIVLQYNQLKGEGKPLNGSE